MSTTNRQESVRPSDSEISDFRRRETISGLLIVDPRGSVYTNQAAVLNSR
jgi:hypothetical protein